MQSIPQCEQCRATINLLLCSRCRKAYYCNKEHQTKDWKRHKPICSNFIKCEGGRSESSRGKNESFDNSVNLGGLETDITLEPTEELLSSYNLENNSYFNEETFKNLVITDPLNAQLNLSIDDKMPPFLHKYKGSEQDIMEEVCRNVIKDMDAYGVCVIDNFLGRERGMMVLDEVTRMYQTGVFKDGQLVSKRITKDLKTIRSDQIVWIDGKEPSCKNIDQLIKKVDAIILKANRMSNNGKMGDFVINGRTKAMVACYPGRGSHYVKHVDNPNKDGRCITAIYYLNKDWDIKQNGGLLRIFPEGWSDQVADIEPLFDRILFFWSDRRNPHEVQPAYKTRYAITLWYFDAVERDEACRRYQRDKGTSDVASTLGK